MKIARFSHNGAINFGILDEGESGGTDLVVLNGDPLFSGFDTTGERIRLADVTLLAPVIPRSKVIGIGKNYLDHVAEMNTGEAPAEPLMFLKPNTSVIGPGDRIVRPAQSTRVDFEGELAVVIGRVAKNVKAGDAASAIFGYTVANDVTARDLQKSDGQWTRAKGFDTFCPLGPVIETEFDLEAATVETRLNGVLAQSAPVTDMIHSVAEIVAYASSVFTLLPGDVILTGTPAGVAAMEAGDTVEIEIAGIGVLSNPVF
ncbi:fumarylacetoacetate hydrolase family protein [Herbiconiux liangxiaofengii]|uniref:fumarylacetoacetate hydrolase family protein n=1 Tax=Herbiconiux liangxiaofengii TaxID=3342795 RepID=UPI0035BA9997